MLSARECCSWLQFGDVVHVKLEMAVTRNRRWSNRQAIGVDGAHEMPCAGPLDHLGNVSQGADVDVFSLL